MNHLAYLRYDSHVLAWDLPTLAVYSPFAASLSSKPAAGNWTYVVDFLYEQIKKIVTSTAMIRWVATTNMDEFRKPILSYKIPLIEGPIKAPNANELVQRPDIRPNVSKLFGKPCVLKEITANNILLQIKTCILYLHACT